MIDIIMSPIRVFKKIVARVNMSYQNDTQETTDKNDIAQVTEIGKENGYITSEDILKNCNKPEDSINELDSILAMGIDLNTRKKVNRNLLT